jgi:hypothetical protein
VACTSFHAQIGTTAETAAANSGCIKTLLPKLAFPESHLVCFVEVGRVEQDLCNCKTHRAKILKLMSLSNADLIYI